MFCNQCGNKIEENSKFCNFCGNKIELSISMVCPSCGGRMTKNNNEIKCDYCDYSTIIDDTDNIKAYKIDKEYDFKRDELQHESNLYEKDKIAEHKKLVTSYGFATLLILISAIMAFTLLFIAT